LRWSKGLKAVFAIAVIDDQVLAEEKLAPDSVKVATLSAYEWRVILDQPYDVRGIVLQLAETGVKAGIGDAALRRYVDSLVDRSSLLPF
jgi:hypothetical protein